MKEEDEGEWVRNSDVDPRCNIWGRKWKTDKGQSGVFYGSLQGIPEGELYWFFPKAATGNDGK